MTYTERFPVAPLTAYVAGCGGIGELLRDRGFADEEGALIYDGHLNETSYNSAIEQGELSLRMADKIAISMLGLHPSSIWSNWFDEDPDALDYGVIEDELLLGRFDSQREFWLYVGDLASTVMDKNKRPRVVGNMFPEARAYLNSLPSEVYEEEAVVQRGLFVGDRCKRNHLIESPADLINRGATGMGCRACARPKLSVGSECGHSHKIESESDLLVTNGGSKVYCRECRRQRSAKSRAQRLAARNLTEQNIIDIKARLAAGEERQALANEFGVAMVTISRINDGGFRLNIEGSEAA